MSNPGCWSSPDERRRNHPVDADDEKRTHYHWTLAPVSGTMWDRLTSGTTGLSCFRGSDKCR